MNLNSTKIDGVYIIENFNAKDERGSFIKTFHSELFEEAGLCTCFRESYFSISNKDVIRGMHFQLPPFDHDKLVYVAKGEVIDVVLDLRKNSKTFGEHISINLSGENAKSIYIPKGLAHGFRSLKEDTIMVYNVSTVYSSQQDSGINYDSFGFEWNIKNPIVSERDKLLKDFKEYILENPF